MSHARSNSQGAMLPEDYAAAIQTVFNRNHYKAARMLGISLPCSYYYINGERPISQGVYNMLCYIEKLGIDEAELATSIPPKWQSGPSPAATALPHTTARHAVRSVPESRRSGDMNDWIAVLKAADCVARWHVHQRRKGAAQEPYINHLLEVARLVAEATEGEDLELVIAALLHDAIEDQEVPREMIAATWGEGVAQLVEEVTDDKSLAKNVRKEEQIKNASKKSDRAKLIKLADKTSNLRAITASPSPEWSVKRRLEYIVWAQKVTDGLRGTNARLERQFDEAAEAAQKSTRP